ncbi:hypothetical protein [Kluyvera intermedia]|nr:hypothetical protein [Kluyvera intermedia]
MGVQHRATNDEEFVSSNYVELKDDVKNQEDINVISLDSVKISKAYNNGKQIANEAAALLDW